jgi:hypothetical protein
MGRISPDRRWAQSTGSAGNPNFPKNCWSNDFGTIRKMVGMEINRFMMVTSPSRSKGTSVPGMPKHRHLQPEEKGPTSSENDGDHLAPEGSPKMTDILPQDPG